MLNPLHWLAEVGVAGWVDMALMALLIYGLLVWLRRTRRATLILAGISILGAVYLLALFLGLVLTTAILRAFFAIFVIVLVVIFQEELRHLFEQIAKWGLNRALTGRRMQGRLPPRMEVEVLTRTLYNLGQARIGALVVMIGQDSLEPHVRGGVGVNGDLSEALLKSIFDPHSMGHDGAVLVKKGRVEKLGVRLPLTEEEDALGPLGTRHAAALGLSEKTDALCLVVSEERGTVSVAHNGALQVVDAAPRLTEIVEAHCTAMTPQHTRQPWHRIFTVRPGEKLAAIAIAFMLWFALVYRTQVVSEYFTVTVDPGPPPAGLAAVQLSPAAVDVRVEGPRRRLRRLRDSEIRLALPVQDVSPGFQMLPVSEGMFTLPEDLRIIDIRPRQVLARFETRQPVSIEP